jgi:hypothetical protein
MTKKWLDIKRETSNRRKEIEQLVAPGAILKIDIETVDKLGKAITWLLAKIDRLSLKLDICRGEYDTLKEALIAEEIQVAIKQRDEEWAKHLSPDLDRWDGLEPHHFMSFPEKAKESREWEREDCIQIVEKIGAEYFANLKSGQKMADKIVKTIKTRGKDKP